MLAKRGQMEAERLADVFCRESRARIKKAFAALDGRNDVAHYKLAQEVLKGQHTWLEEGIMAPPSSVLHDVANEGSAPQPTAAVR
jgi:hypothetical protein